MKWLIAIWFLFSTASVLGDPKESLSPTASKTTVEPGEKLILEMSLPKTPDADLTKLEIHDEPLLESELFKVLEKDTLDTGKKLLIRYTLVLYKIGSFLIPPVEIKWEGREFTSEFVQVNGVTTRPENDEKLREPFDELPLPLPWGWIISLTVLGVALALALKKLIPQWRRTTPPVVPRIAWNEWVLTQLESLRQSPDLDFFILVLKKYLSEKTKNPLSCLTSLEIERDFRRDQEVTRLLPIFMKCDQKKYRDPSFAINLIEEIDEAKRIVQQCN